MDLDRLLELIQQPRNIGIMVGVVVGLWLLKKLFSRPASSAHHTVSRCANCGWTGQVSKYKPTCPRCAKPIQL